MDPLLITNSLELHLKKWQNTLLIVFLLFSLKKFNTALNTACKRIEQNKIV